MNKRNISASLAVILSVFLVTVVAVGGFFVNAKKVSAVAGPTLTAVAHNETAKTITLTYSEPVHLTAEWGDGLVSAGNLHSAFSIFVATSDGEGGWDYYVGNTDRIPFKTDTRAPDVAIASAAFNGGGSSGTILTITYTGSLVTGTTYLVDSWVPNGGVAGTGGYDIKSASEVVLADGVDPAFAADTVAPTISLFGPSTVNLKVGDLYTDAGASALDNIDGDITANIVTVNTVNTAVAGAYTVTYNVSDASLNPAVEVNRVVNVSANGNSSGHGSSHRGGGGGGGGVSAVAIQNAGTGAGAVVSEAARIQGIRNQISTLLQLVTRLQQKLSKLRGF